MSELELNIAQLALADAPFGILVLRDHRILWANSSLLATLSTTLDEIVGTTGDSVSPALAALFDPTTEQFAFSPNEREIRRLQRTRAGLPAEGLEIQYFQDITDLVLLDEKNAHLQERLRNLDMRDPDTGLMSRNATLHALDSHISRSRRYGNSLSVIQLTLTPPLDAQSPQDTLRAISQEFNTQLRWADQIGWLDPTHLLLILPETSLKDAQELASKLERDRIALTSRTEGWSLDFATTSWRKGDDPRKLLQRLQDNEQDTAA